MQALKKNLPLTISKRGLHKIGLGLASCWAMLELGGCRLGLYTEAGAPLRMPHFKGLYLHHPLPYPAHPTAAPVKFHFYTPDPTLKLAAEDGGVSSDTFKFEAPVIVPAREEGILNLDAYYAQIQLEYEVKPSTDSPKMREFKSLKDSLNLALKKDGYTEEEIKRFYVLNYLSYHTNLAQAQAAPAAQLPSASTALRPDEP